MYRNWELAVPFLGIFVLNFRYCVFVVQHIWYKRIPILILILSKEQNCIYL
jgi:hypothetical protein